MIKVLKNPKTDKYLQFKKFILSKEFAWRYNISTNMDFYSHVFLQRPELAGYTLPNSSVTNENLQVMAEIIDHNGLYKDCLLYTSPSPRDKTVSRMPSSA